MPWLCALDLDLDLDLDFLGGVFVTFGVRELGRT